MRLTVLLPLLCAVAVPAYAQQNGTGISGIHFNTASPMGVMPITGFGPDNFRSSRSTSLQQAQQLIASGDYVQADSLLATVIGETPSRQARFLKGMAKLGLGDAAAARRYFEQSLYRGRNGHPGAMSGLAIAEIRLGNADAARNILHKLQYQQEKCGHSCDRAGALKQAVGVVEKALA
ncbi:tetratricopeptide repeat protein [Sphingobium sp. AS12]|uniref:tetratricopeptide repeat protein n=1 Tax=Sphingobium sp. AS12 TaxID=2849495 RepID=UPI001C31BF66|nr:tetratricopeptide repeat protein [Sphingobium sp. AS12]MBV2147414.1 tetratricopeptide repeat protein [Sphingobium sp. AS12]